MSRPLDIADVVTRAERDHGLTHGELAEAARVSSKQISRWASGENRPAASKVARALADLDIDPRGYGLRLPPGYESKFADPATGVSSEHAPEWFTTAMSAFETRLFAKLDRLQRIAEKAGR